MDALSSDDVALVERARRGDVGAYEELVRRYQELALRTAHLIAPDGDADDACQEAFVKAWSALPRFRPGSAFRPWILRIVANEARNRRRSAGRRTGLALRVDSLARDEGPETPEAVLVAREASEQLMRGVDSLRDDDREIIAVRYFLQLSEEEAAGVLGIARGTVKSRLSRAIGRLRAVLESASGAQVDD